MPFAKNVALSAPVRTNLLALSNTDRLINRTNERLSTGLKVNSPIDDAVAFFAARSLNDRADDFDAKKSGIDQAISTVNAALESTDAIDSLLKQAKGQIISARTGTDTERETLRLQFLETLVQVQRQIDDTSYQGVNLIGNSATRLQVSFSEKSTSYLNIVGQALNIGYNAAVSASNISTGNLFGAASVNTTNSVGFLLSGVLVSNVTAGVSAVFQTGTASAVFIASLFGADFAQVGGLAGSTVAATETLMGSGFDALQTAVNRIDTAISRVRGVAKALGTTVATLQIRLDFTENYVNVLSGGAAKLTLANAKDEGANLVALQTRSQLGIQALSFAGQQDQSVLRLFG